MIIIRVLLFSNESFKNVIDSKLIVTILYSIE